MRTEQRPIVLSAVRSLVANARSIRGRLPARDPVRQFYLGVEAAADELLRPELGMARQEGWLERETPLFRDGYTKTSALLAQVAASETPPPRIPVPEPDAPG